MSSEGGETKRKTKREVKVTLEEGSCWWILKSNKSHDQSKEVETSFLKSYKSLYVMSGHLLAEECCAGETTEHTLFFKSKVKWERADGCHDCDSKALLRRLSLLSYQTEQKGRNHIQEEDR